MNSRTRICYLLSILRIHRPDCEHCSAWKMCGHEMLKRLEELNWRTQPTSLNQQNHGEVLEGVDSDAAGVATNPPIVLPRQKKIA